MDENISTHFTHTQEKKQDVIFTFLGAFHIKEIQGSYVACNDDIFCSRKWGLGFPLQKKCILAF